MSHRARILVLLLALLAAACSGGDHEAATGSANDAGPEEEVAEAGRDSAQDSDESAGDAAGGGVVLADLPEAQTGDRVIKEGTVSIAVPGEEFDRAFGAVIEAATRLGGTVVSSATSTDDNDAVAGSVTVRVPVERYEQLLVGVAEIGEVRSRRITAQDVTAEFVDLESRLRHAEAQERFYLELLQEADGVSDAIAVQQQLDGIQSQIEQIKGRLQYLDARTSFSTLTVELFEPDATPTTIASTSGRPALAQWWETAQDALVNVVGIMLVAAFFAGPLLIPAALAWLVWRSLRRREATAAPTA